MVETVTTLKQVVSDMSKTVGEATMVMSQISDTVLNYKQALLQTTTQVLQVQATRDSPEYYNASTELTTGLDKKARQILLDTTKGEDNYMNIYKIKEKAATALAGIVPPLHRAQRYRR